MKNNSQAMCTAVVLCAAAAVLGCSESTQSVDPAAQIPLGIASGLDQRALPRLGDSQRTELDAKVLETFSGGKIRIRCKHYHYGPGNTNCRFRTTVAGTATGPHPGTFTAKGGWMSGFNAGHSFIELFTIHSGSSQIAGSISFHTFSGQGGPLGTYQYVSSVGNGTVQVQAIGKNNLQEAFQYQSSIVGR